MPADLTLAGLVFDTLNHWSHIQQPPSTSHSLILCSIITSIDSAPINLAFGNPTPADLALIDLVQMFVPYCSHTQCSFTNHASSAHIN